MSKHFIVVALIVASKLAFAQTTANKVQTIFEKLKNSQTLQRESKTAKLKDLEDRKLQACRNLSYLPPRFIEDIANAHSVHPDSIRMSSSPHVTNYQTCEVSYYLPVGACRYRIFFTDTNKPTIWALSLVGQSSNCRGI